MQMSLNANKATPANLRIEGYRRPENPQKT